MTIASLIIILVLVFAILFAWIKFLATVRYIVDRTGETRGLDNLARATTAFGGFASLNSLTLPTLSGKIRHHPHSTDNCNDV